MTVRGPAGRHAGARRPGSTLVELMVVVTIGGILAAFAVPSFRRAVEQSRIDQASASLRSIWAAQRVYRLIHGGAYASDLSTLRADHLIDELNTAAASFVFTAASDGTASAERDTGSAWSGTLTIDADGNLGGSVTDGTIVLVPPLQFLGG